MTVVYGFEATSIQRYILASGKLKDMVGASELVEALCKDILQQTLGDLGISDGSINFARRAGGALTAFFDYRQQAEDFRDLWTLRVQKTAPDLGFTQALVAVNHSPGEAHLELMSRMRQDRNRGMPRLPLTSPLAKRYLRTGVVAVSDPENAKHLAEHDFEAADAATLAKRKFSDATNLVKNIGLTMPDRQVLWPKVLRQEEEDPFNYAMLGNDESAYVGLVHADGNSLGALLHQLQKSLSDVRDVKEYAAHWLAFSNAIERATVRAVRKGANGWINQARMVNGDYLMPARPLILGGDDVTVIVKADQALAFTRDFMAAFERETEKEFDRLRDRLPVLPKRLTACAGIAFIKTQQPFHQAYTLTESLCKRAKVQSKANQVNDLIPASLAFHRVTTGRIDSWGDVLDRELTTPQKLTMTMMPYALHEGHGMPVLNHLKNLYDQLEENTSKGSVRELARLLRSGGSQWKQALNRWLETVKKDPDHHDLPQLESCFRALTCPEGGSHKPSPKEATGKQHPSLPEDFFAEGNIPVVDPWGRTPLGDALALRGIGGIL